MTCCHDFIVYSFRPCHNHPFSALKDGWKSRIVRTSSHKKTCRLSTDALRDLVPFIKFKKREKRPWRNVTFSKAADFSLHFY